MASLHAVYRDIGKQFVCLDRHPDYSAVKAVFLGGNSIYSLGNARDERNGRDWDDAIIVSTKQAIFHLVNDQRRSLMEMLSIVREECPGLRVPDPLSSRWDEFDAVRFAGLDRLKYKLFMTNGFKQHPLLSVFMERKHHLQLLASLRICWFPVFGYMDMSHTDA